MLQLVRENRLEVFPREGDVEAAGDNQTWTSPAGRRRILDLSRLDDGDRARIAQTLGHPPGGVGDYSRVQGRGSASDPPTAGGCQSEPRQEQSDRRQPRDGDPTSPKRRRRPYRVQAALERKGPRGAIGTDALKPAVADRGDWKSHEAVRVRQQPPEDPAADDAPDERSDSRPMTG